MFTLTTLTVLSVLAFAPIRDFGAEAHVSFFHPSMYGFNISSASDPHFSYDNRPVAPLADFTFNQWWFHGHLDFPPNEGDFFELPAGGVATTEIACTKSATSFFDAASGGDIRRKDNPNDPCPGSGMEVYHTQGFSDLKGCGLAIAYESDVSKIQPEDMTIFSINQTCVWTRFTDFAVPARMPACPPGGCTCAWFWIHSADSGSEQNYMTGFKCNVTNAVSQVPLAQAQVPRRCGADPDHGVNQATPGNCTYGAKQPLYWFQKERNNVFEDQFAPPFYLDLYNFRDGPQDDIFADSYEFPLPVPGVNQTAVPKFFRDGTGAAASGAGGGASSSAAPPQSATPTGTTAQATQSASAGGSNGALSSPSASAPSAAASATSATSAAPSSVVVTATAVQTSTKTSTSVVVATETQTIVVVATSTAVVTVVPSASSAAAPATSTAIAIIIPLADPSSSASSFAAAATAAGPAPAVDVVAAAAEPTALTNAGLTAAILADTSGSSGAGTQNLACHSKRGGVPSAPAQSKKQLRRNARAFHATGSFKRRALRKPSDLWRIF